MAGNLLDHLDEGWRVQLRSAILLRLHQAEQTLFAQRGEQGSRKVARTIDLIGRGIDRGSQAARSLQVVGSF